MGRGRGEGGGGNVGEEGEGCAYSLCLKPGMLVSSSESPAVCSNTEREREERSEGTNMQEQPQRSALANPTIE